MAFSIDTKVKDLRKSEAASDIIAQYSPGFKTDPQLTIFNRSAGLIIIGSSMIDIVERVADSHTAVEGAQQRCQVLLKECEITFLLRLLPGYLNKADQ